MAGRCQLGFGQGSMLSLPFGDGSEPIANEQHPTRRVRHPGGDAHTLGGSGVANAVVNVSIDGDRQLRRWLSSRHDRSVLPR